MDINKNTVNSLISETWQLIKEKVEGGHPLSSEKTLCFLFAMEIVRKVGNGITIDFENQCYQELDGESRYLDLMFYTDPKFIVSIEFKLPRKSSSGASNQPQTRKAIYRDIARLKYLRRSSLKAKACFFLMATNEHAYLNNGAYRNHPDFKVSHGHSLSLNNALAVDGLSLSGVKCKFEWDNIELKGTKYFRKGAYSWLRPVRV